MIKIIAKAEIMNYKAEDAVTFFINCTDQQYAAWWQDTHMQFHTIKRTKSVIGSIVYFDEYVGSRRLKFQSLITHYDSRGIVEYQMIKFGVKLPGWLHLEFTQKRADVSVIHTLKIGFSGWLSILDCIIRLFIPKTFINDLEQHAKEEFNRLSNLSSE